MNNQKDRQHKHELTTRIRLPIAVAGKFLLNLARTAPEQP